MNRYPSMKAKQLLAALKREPLNYRIHRQNGSHRRLKSDTHPPITFSFHDGDTIGPGTVRKVFEGDVGLTADEAAAILGL